MADADDARLIGWRLQRIRDDRNKSLRVIAGLAGMSYSTLHRIEHGRRVVTLSEIQGNVMFAVRIQVVTLGGDRWGRTGLCSPGSPRRVPARARKPPSGT